MKQEINKLIIILLVIFCFNGCKKDEVDMLPPNEVTNFKTTVDDGKVVITWTDPTDDDFQKVEVSYLSTVVEIIKGKQTIEINGLTNDLSYTFTLKSVDTQNNRSSGIQINAKPSDLTPPSEISNFNTILGTTSIKLTWTDPKELDFQKVVINVVGSSYEILETYEILKGIEVKEFTGLTQGEWYTYKICTVDAKNNKSNGFFLLCFLAK